LLIVVIYLHDTSGNHIKRFHLELIFCYNIRDDLASPFIFAANITDKCYIT
jgi:hypothetical protein